MIDPVYSRLHQARHRIPGLSKFSILLALKYAGSTSSAKVGERLSCVLKAAQLSSVDCKILNLIAVVHHKPIHYMFRKLSPNKQSKNVTPAAKEGTFKSESNLEVNNITAVIAHRNIVRKYKCKSSKV